MMFKVGIDIFYYIDIIYYLKGGEKTIKVVERLVCSSRIYYAKNNKYSCSINWATNILI